MNGAVRLLALALALTVLRHVILLAPTVVDPGQVLELTARQPALYDISQDAALDAFRAGDHQPVDLRRNPGIPIFGGRLAWLLPMPNSLVLLDRYRKNAKAENLIFLVSPTDREQGEQIARSICLSLGLRTASITTWEPR